MVNYINGPITVGRFYSEKYDKDIYLFGDDHSSLKGTCWFSKAKHYRLFRYIF